MNIEEAELLQKLPLGQQRVGVGLKEQELFIYKDNIKDFGVDADKLRVTDGRLTIIIIVNKL